MVWISIHAPRVGSDGWGDGCWGRGSGFQSTLPVWGATRNALGSGRVPTISIHAPRVGSDTRTLRLARYLFRFQSTLPVWGATAGRPGRRRRRPDFNPRSPCGERLVRVVDGTEQAVFQSTLPVWGATTHCRRSVSGSQISIHAPRVGSDSHNHSSLLLHYYFNPRSPCGERQRCGAVAF